MHEAKEAAEERGKKGRPGRLQRAADALQAWARIPRPCRDALKHADPFRVDELEMRIMDFLETEVHPFQYLQCLSIQTGISSFFSAWFFLHTMVVGTNSCSCRARRIFVRQE